MVASRILIARMRPSLSHDCCLGGGSLLDRSGASLVPFLGATLVLFSVVFLLALVVITRGFFGFFWDFFSGSTGSWDLEATGPSGGLSAVVEGQRLLVTGSTETWALGADRLSGGLLGIVGSEGSLLAEDIDIGVAREELLLE